MGAALITGASSGIGLELARVFAAHHHDLVLVARRRAELERIAAELSAAHGVRVTAIDADLSVRSAARDVCERTRDLGVDVLVNNAGFGLWGRFHELALDEQLGMIALNVTALTELAHRFLRDMLKAGRGRIMNVASTAAFQPGPLMAVYYATKAYVLSLTEAIAEEVRGSGVTVSALCPGATVSAFQARAGLEGHSLLRAVAMDAATVARAGYRGLMRGKVIIIPGLHNRLGAQMLRLAPRALVRRFIKAVQTK